MTTDKKYQWLLALMNKQDAAARQERERRQVKPAKAA